MRTGDLWEEWGEKMTLNFKDIRGEIAGLENRLYFDNAGASFPPPVVNAVIKDHLDLEARVGGYVAQEQKAFELEAVYDSLACLLGGKASNYALTSGAVDAWNRAFYSVTLTAKDNVVITYNEYCSNYIALLHRSQSIGFEIRVAGVDGDGVLDLPAMETLIDANTKLVTASTISSSSGQILDVAAVGALCLKHDVLFLLDACQAIGQVPVDVDEIGCDMMAGTSRKYLRGPRGVGFLYVSDKALKRLTPTMMSNMSAVWSGLETIDVREDARLFEAWERSVALQLGFGAALKYLINLGPEALMAQSCRMAALLREKLTRRNDITVQDQEGPRGAIVTFTKQGEDPEDTKARLAKNNIVVQVGSVVHTRLDLEERGLNSIVRVSTQYYTSEADLDALITAL